MLSSEKAEKITIIAIICVFALMMLYVFQGSVHSFVKEGEPIPSFSILDMNNKTLTNSDFIGKVILINFWTTWCPPCVEEMPSLVDFYKQFNGHDGITVLLINSGETTETITKFLTDNKYDVAVYRDPSTKVPKDFGTFKFPESFIVDKKGILRKKVIGEINWMEDNVTSFIQSLARE
jgi:cytochrome c biogenesis protein CcmG, thiol:disulfide interchange protein DsbE